MRYLSIILSLAILAAAAWPGPAAARDVDTRPIGNFIEFMKLCKNSPPEMRYAIWRKRCFEPSADIMRKIVFKTGDEAKIKKSMMKTLDRIFANYRMHFDMFVELKGYFQSMLDGAETDFKKFFPDASFDEFSFYLLVGNNSFNGRADLVDGKPAFEISAEMFESVDGLRLTLMHELFHLYHMKCYERAGNRPEERLYFPLVFEGCAVYFTGRATGSNIEECMRMGLPAYLGLFDGADFRPKCDKVLVKSAKLLYNNLDRPVSDELYALFFKASGGGAETPARIGYYIGFKVAEGAAEGTPIEKIVKMKKKDIVRLCRTQLKKIFTKAEGGK